MKKPIIFIAGPTASGKTKTSVLLAKKINGEIISADSMQVYKKMDIGTAKVTPEEMQGVPHYMIDELDPRDGCNIAWFASKVKKYINAIHQKGKIPIIVGGTGFYINAILFDTEFEEEEADTTYRESLYELARDKGAAYLHAMLQKVDPKSAEAIHMNNIKRVIRALEYYHQTGEKISDHNANQKQKRFTQSSPYDYKFFALNMDRSVLYDRINLRIDQMMQEGLEKEVKYFYDQKFEESLPSMKAIGYKEFFPYFRGEITLQEAVEKLKKNTRNYAKRQLTWFRHQASPIFIEVDELNFDANHIVDTMIAYINEDK